MNPEKTRECRRSIDGSTVLCRCQTERAFTGLLLIGTLKGVAATPYDQICARADRDVCRRDVQKRGCPRCSVLRASRTLIIANHSILCHTRVCARARIHTHTQSRHRRCALCVHVPSMTSSIRRLRLCWDKNSQEHGYVNERVRAYMCVRDEYHIRFPFTSTYVWHT